MLLDIVLPGMNGVALLRAPRRLNPEVKGIMMSGYAAPETIQASRAERICGFLQKPFSIETLADAVRRALAPGEEIIPSDSQERL